MHPSVAKPEFSQPMRLTYRSPRFEDSRVGTDYLADISRKVMPRWIFETVSLLRPVAYFGVAYVFLRSVILASALAVAVWFLEWVWLVGFIRFHRYMERRYLASLGDAQLREIEVTDEYVVTTFRGAKMSFPLRALSRVFEENSKLCLQFSTPALVAVPFEAFATPSARCRFAEAIEALARKTV